MKKVKSFEEACELRGYDAATIIPDVSAMPEGLQQFTIATIKRAIIAEAIKEGIHPQPGEWSYEPVFNKRTSRFVYTYAHFTCTCTLLGARLSFNTEAEGDFFGQNFHDLHVAALTVQ